MLDMEQSAASSVPCVFTTQDPSSQVVVTQVQLPQEQVHPTTASAVAASFQPSTDSEQQRPVTPLDARIQDGVSTIPAVQQALYQTEASESVSGQSLSAQGQFPTSYFSTTSIEGLVESSSSSAAVSVSPTSYDDVTQKLNQLFANELTQIQGLTEDHWKVQEFPLARIKKIMRMDEDVRMISAEVPVMLSKALELFITELSLRAWLQTEESKRRTVQRSDIAMAITKNDMFDFLIDIVPREEIQLRSKTQKNTEGGESLQLLPPELLQLCIQQLAQQALSLSTEGGLGEDESSMAGSDSNDSNATVGQLQQQLQLLQQLIQIQQLQQEQQQVDQSPPSLGQTMQLQHPPILDQTPPTDTSTQSSSSIATGGTPTLDTEVLYSGMTTPGAANGAGMGGAAGVTGGIQFTTALEQLTTTGATAGNQNTDNNILSIQPDQHGGSIITTVSSVGVNFTNGGQQTLHHVDPSSISFPHQQPVVSQPQPHELLQQPGTGGGSISHSNTVIIQQPLTMDDIVTTTTIQQQQSGTTVTTLLESQGAGGQFPHHHGQLHVHLDQSQQGQQLISATTGGGQTAANLVHHVLVDPSTMDHTTAPGGGHYQLTPGGGDGGVASPVIQSDPVAQYSNAGAAPSGGDAGGGSMVFSLEGLPTSSTYSS